MSEQLNDHERRLSTLEGEMKSVATKADLADLKHELTQFVYETVHSAIKEQTEIMNNAFAEVNKALKQQSDDIRELREIDSRLNGAADTIKIALPFLISVIAVVVAVLK